MTATLVVKVVAQAAGHGAGQGVGQGGGVVMQGVGQGACWQGEHGGVQQGGGCFSFSFMWKRDETFTSVCTARSASCLRATFGGDISVPFVLDACLCR